MKDILMTAGGEIYNVRTCTVLAQWCFNIVFCYSSLFDWLCISSRQLLKSELLATSRNTLPTRPCFDAGYPVLAVLCLRF